MSNKDLNLALDQNLIQPTDTQQNSTQEQSTPSHYEEAANLDAMTASPGTDTSNNYQGQPERYSRRGKPSSYASTWLATLNKQQYPWLASGILLINLIFLLLAGFWLSNQSGQPSSALPSATKSLHYVDDQAMNAFDQRLVTLQAKVEQLELTLHEQQRLIATSSKDLSHEIQLLGAELKTLKAPTIKKGEPKTTTKTAKPEEKQPITQWYVNIGTFSSKEAAQRLKKQLLALGHTVQVNTTSFDNKPAYRVQLPGFKDRTAAELTARKIMEKTNLNGLWAWKDE